MSDFLGAGKIKSRVLIQNEGCKTCKKGKAMSVLRRYTHIINGRRYEKAKILIREDI